MNQAAEKLPADTLNETNFADYAARAVDRYQSKGLLRDATFWGDVVAQYDKALASKKPVSRACRDAIEKRIQHYQVRGRIVDVLLWSSILGHYNKALEKARP